MSDTSAPLIAADVAECCQIVLDEIRDDREQLKAKIMASKRIFPVRCFEELPVEEQIIPPMHRADEAKRLELICELALSIAADNVDLRMQVSLDDFQLIKRPYLKRKKPCIRGL